MEKRDNIVNVYTVTTYLLVGCMLLLPIHTQVIYMVLPYYLHMSKDIFSVWKEILIAIVAVIFIIKYLLNIESAEIMMIDILIFAFMMFLTLLLLISDNKTESFYGFRVFVEPFIIYYLARSAKLTLKVSNTLFVIMYFGGVLIGVWGIVQAAFLGDKFLIDLGYETSNGKLPSSFYIAMFFFQRAVGTFASPNTFGMYLQICMMLGIYLKHVNIINNKIIYYIGNIVMICAILYTFSRSALLALLISILLFILLSHGFKKGFIAIFKFALVLAVTFSIVYLHKMDIVTPLITHTINTITLEDPSTVGHLDSLNESMIFAAQNPFGVGLGKTGPRASARSGIFINSENSFFILLFDLGVFGLLLYTFVILLIALKLYEKIKLSSNDEKLLYMVIFSILIGQMMVWNLLPYIVELEITLLLFFTIGLACNKRIGAM